MTKEELAHVVDGLNITQRAFGISIGAHESSVCRWLYGDRPIPEVYIHRMNNTYGKKKIKELLTLGKQSDNL